MGEEEAKAEGAEHSAETFRKTGRKRVGCEAHRADSAAWEKCTRMCVFVGRGEEAERGERIDRWQGRRTEAERNRETVGGRGRAGGEALHPGGG